MNDLHAMLPHVLGNVCLGFQVSLLQVLFLLLETVVVLDQAVTPGFLGPLRFLFLLFEHVHVIVIPPV